jgi:DNA sulfur modification protein DndB
MEVIKFSLPVSTFTSGFAMKDFDSGFMHTFPAVRGVQAGRTFFIAMCPLLVIPKIFVFDEEEVPAELRAQRTINRSRIPEIANYLVANPESYVLSALTASVDAPVNFIPSGNGNSMASVGMLNIPMGARILINDGQHRRAAIEDAVKRNQMLGHDNVPVLFFADAGLIRSQQMFADLNKHAVRPSVSLGTLYDQRDATARLACYLATECETFKGLTEMEKSAISNRSTNLFALSSIKLASRVLLRLGKRDEVTEDHMQIAKNYWEEVAKNIPDWQRAKAGQVQSSELREKTVHAHSLALHALAQVGAHLLEENKVGWKKQLAGLKSVDWARNNKVWEGRALDHGRLKKSTVSVTATAAVIKQAIGLTLTSEEKKLIPKAKQK